MPRLVTEAKLKDAVEGETFLVGGTLSAVEGIKYDFHMGSRILKASFRRPIDIEELAPADRNSLCVDPGEAVFVLTREKLNLPNNIMAILTPKRKLAHGGIIVLGGLAIDPLYKGVLWVGLYNFSSTPYALEPGRKLIGAMFYELDESEAADFDVPESASVTDFPDELVALINQYRPVELKGLQEELAETRRELAALKTDLVTDKDWKEDFKRSLDEHNRQLGLLIEGLKDEKEVRRSEDEKIQGRLESMSNWFFGLRAGGWIIALLLAAAAGWGIPKVLDQLTQPQPTRQLAPAEALSELNTPPTQDSRSNLPSP
ncbi:MAG TPA: hypothetical protein VF138_12600 [Caulobacteraceae bacterium]